MKQGDINYRPVYHGRYKNMRKKIICILISGIFLLTSFSSINTSTKAKCVPESSKIQNTLCQNKIESIPLQIPNSTRQLVFYYMIGFGNFWVENDSVIGPAVTVVILFYYIIPQIYHNMAVNVSLHNTGNHTLYYNVRYTNHIFTLNEIRLL